jgi:hypothetical protein
LIDPLLHLLVIVQQLEGERKGVGDNPPGYIQAALAGPPGFVAQSTFASPALGAVMFFIETKQYKRNRLYRLAIMIGLLMLAPGLAMVVALFTAHLPAAPQSRTGTREGGTY